MPNELIIPKGPYPLLIKRRYIEKRKKENLRYKDRRTLVLRPKRTILGYVKIIGLYLALYILIGIILTCNILIVYFLRLPKDKPLIQKSASLSSVPGHYEGDRKIIRYQSDQRMETTPYIQQLYKFLEKYGRSGLDHLRGCNLDDNWGYNTGQPCIILKLNYAVNFKPITYNSPVNMPDEAPKELHKYFMKLPLGSRFDRIWVGCSFLSNETTEKIEYIPRNYFYSDCMDEKKNIFLSKPSENLTMDRSTFTPAYNRLVGVQIQNIPLNQDVIVKCSIFAKNIPDKFASVIYLFRVNGVKVTPNPDPDYEFDME